MIAVFFIGLLLRNKSECERERAESARQSPVFLMRTLYRTAPPSVNERAETAGRHKSPWGSSEYTDRNRPEFQLGNRLVEITAIRQSAAGVRPKTPSALLSGETEEPRNAVSLFNSSNGQQRCGLALSPLILEMA